MSDLIKLLPENVANQIAAGEVIQRPASVVKELLENAVDAGATKITLVIKEAGRMLVQVIDNGCGMSETDARMSFERHATSKIAKADDLFHIYTLGFRGEALASIAAVAQVEMKSRRKSDELGTCINIEGSKIISQEICNCDYGTSIAVKNLFFNVPARRNFLKSNTQELKHIMEEFTKVALINPQISFTLYNNDSLLYDLMPEKFKQRIVNLVNKSYNDKIIPIEADTESIKISGYIGKPESAKKTKNTDQFFFVNNRYIRHPYLKHAIESSYQELLPADSYPMYFVKIDIAPEMIDINIHPTKTEINFQDARMVYAILKSSIKQAFGQYSLNVPSLDFDVEQSIDFPIFDANKPISQPSVKIDPNYNPFGGMESFQKKPANDDWKKFYAEMDNKYNDTFNKTTENSENQIEIKSHFTDLKDVFIQSQNNYIVGSIKNSLIIIDQERAHQRILYEKILTQLDKEETSTQTDMFPETITLSYDEGIILEECKEKFEQLGFNYEKLGQNNYVINTHPSNISPDEIRPFLEKVLNDLKSEHDRSSNRRNQLIAKATAKKLCIKSGKMLQNEEMQSIASQLSLCQVPDIDPEGNLIYVILDMEAVEKMFHIK